jgi:hypothetical protein
MGAAGGRAPPHCAKEKTLLLFDCYDSQPRSGGSKVSINSIKLEQIEPLGQAPFSQSTIKSEHMEPLGQAPIGGWRLVVGDW